jgi:hypothetical protein
MEGATKSIRHYDYMHVRVKWSEVKFMATPTTTDRCADEDTWCLKFLGFDSGWGEWNPHQIQVPTPIHVRRIRVMRTPPDMSSLNLSLFFFFLFFLICEIFVQQNVIKNQILRLISLLEGFILAWQKQLFF